MLQTPRAIEQASGRIERAYLRRRAQWRQVNLDPRVWSAAVAMMMEANRIDPRAPLDPELYVACVASEEVGSDPWTELTRNSSLKRYLARVRAIIRTLRREIKSEVRRLERLAGQGEDVEVLLFCRSRDTSALSRYIFALRHGRKDLADTMTAEAQSQHWGCPLYKDATAELLPANAYPVGPLSVEGPPRSGISSFSLN